MARQGARLSTARLLLPTGAIHKLHASRDAIIKLAVAPVLPQLNSHHPAMTMAAGRRCRRYETLAPTSLFLWILAAHCGTLLPRCIPSAFAL